MRIVWRCATLVLLLYAAMRAASAGPAPILEVGACKDQGPPYDKTIAACTEVIQHGDQLTARDRAAAFRIRGYSRYQAEDNQGAISDLSQAIALDPTDPISFFYRAAARAAVKDLAGAAQDESESLRLRPDDADTLVNRALIYRQERLFDQAYEDATRAITLKPEARAYLARAEICFDSATQKGRTLAPCDLTAALADIGQVKQLSDSDYTDADAFALEGLIYESQGQCNKAYTAYENGLDADFGCEECLAGEARIKGRPGACGKQNQGSQGGEQEPDATKSLLARINAEIGRAVYYSGRKLLVTTQLRQVGGGLLQIDGHLCTGLSLSSASAQIAACRASDPQGADTMVRFAPGDVDAGSIHMESSAQTYRVLFMCKGSKPCVARPDGQAYFPGAWMTCLDGATCNRLVVDFSSLIDRLAAGGP